MTEEPEDEAELDEYVRASANFTTSTGPIRVTKRMVIGDAVIVGEHRKRHQSETDDPEEPEAEDSNRDEGP